VKTSVRFFIVVCLAIAAAAPSRGQEEVYLKVTSPGLTRVMIGLPVFTSRPGTDPAAANT